MKQFLSCDWGTTAFRLRLIETEGLKIIGEQSSKQGIAETHEVWKQSGRNEADRLSFYLNIISGYIKAIEERTGTLLKDVPLMISGMASSTIGMINLPYKELPVAVDGSDLTVHHIEPSANFRNKAIVISGVRSEDDVIRGEETKLVGCASGVEDKGSRVYIFPGTHTKHVEVKNGEAAAFQTYMTGEFFELLSRKSILSVSVKEGEGLHSGKNLESFEKGVRSSMHSNLLHSCFHVRTNDVFKKLSHEENFYYLSGLLIGTELLDLIKGAQRITIVGNAVLNAQNIAAFRVLDLLDRAKVEDADQALIKGQFEVFKKQVGV